MRYPQLCEIQQLIGDLQTTEYKRGGNDRDSGCDCYGLWEIWLKTLFGIQCNKRDGTGTTAVFYRNFKKYENTYPKIEEPKNHCFVVMKVASKRQMYEGHCGVYWNGQVIEMREDSKCQFTKYESSDMRQRLAGLYLHPELLKLN